MIDKETHTHTHVISKPPPPPKMCLSLNGYFGIWSKKVVLHFLANPGLLFIPFLPALLMQPLIDGH